MLGWSDAVAVVVMEICSRVSLTSYPLNLYFTRFVRQSGQLQPFPVDLWTSCRLIDDKLSAVDWNPI